MDLGERNIVAPEEDAPNPPHHSIALMGRGVTRGYAIGKAFIIHAHQLEVPHYQIDPDNVPEECERLDVAIAEVEQELRDLIAELPDDAPKEMSLLLNVHRLMVTDPELASATKEIIRERGHNAEWALILQQQHIIEAFEQMDDEYMRERSNDIRQVIERVLIALSDDDNLGVMGLYTHRYDGRDNIVVAHDISPADMVKLRDAQFSAFITDIGGTTSHTAIVARSMNLPAVVGLGSAYQVVEDGDLLIVDAVKGLVLVNPPDDVLKAYQAKQAQFLKERDEVLRKNDQPAITLDGESVKIFANIEQTEETDHALKMGADGIGLFRTEFLFMNDDGHLPSEEEQYAAYRYVVSRMSPKPVTIRTLDLGQDKDLDAIQAGQSAGDALGLRGVRYCLAHPDLFKTQMRALWRASAHGSLRVMFPMVGSLGEIHECKRLFELARQELVAENVPIGTVTLGVMLEVPALVMMIDQVLQEVEFVSIGTNDLVQYGLAINRCDSEVAHLYDAVHPGILAMIYHVLQAGHRLGKPISICGEMAGQTEYTRLLLAMGLRVFSMNTQTIPDVRNAVRHCDTTELARLYRAQGVNALLENP